MYSVSTYTVLLNLYLKIDLIFSKTGMPNNHFLQSTVYCIPLDNIIFILDEICVPQNTMYDVCMMHECEVRMTHVHLPNPLVFFDVHIKNVQHQNE